MVFILLNSNRPALNVKLQDDNFPADKFEYVVGFSSAKWARIQPSANVSHVAVVRPKMIGYFNFTHATISYMTSDKSTKLQVIT